MLLSSPLHFKASRNPGLSAVPDDKTGALRLESLTSLRFFAAVMIVVNHTLGGFGLDPHSFFAVPLAQGVSFFFVLSGFILTHVYQNLGAGKPFLLFLCARIARIWPVFFFSVCLMYIVSPKSMLATSATTTALVWISQALLVHGWIPQRLYYFSLNAPSWSISTELFFYLAFPVLLLNLRRNYLATLVVVGLVTASLICLCHVCGLPLGGTETEMSRISRHGLLYINPLSRMLEFYVGMLTYLLVSTKRSSSVPRSLLTILEIVAIAAIVVTIVNVDNFTKLMGLDVTYPELQLYLRYSGNMFGYAFLIAVVSFQRGCLSVLLKLPALVFLGEISYSIYLLHYSFMSVYESQLSWHSAASAIVRYAIFWAVLILAAAATYNLLEKPARNSLRKILSAGVDRL